MLKVRYIADGVFNDIENLLNDFIKENSVDFSVFASVWKKHNFSLIFMGRQGHKEILDFTHELFRIATQFLTSSSYLYQVGGIFLLYALYRNQLLKPPAKIRILFSHWENIAKIREEAHIKKYVTLHYVIDYLVENAFDFVACQTLMGPRMSFVKQMSKKPDKVSKFMANLKADLNEFQQSNALQQLKDLYLDYTEAKKDIKSCVMMKSEMTKAELADKYDFYIKSLSDLLKQNVCGSSNSCAETKILEEDIGSRRALIKATQFSRKTAYRNIECTDSDDSPDASHTELKTEEGPKTVTRKKRIPKEQRRIGRPRKYKIIAAEENNEDPDEVIEVLDICDVLEEKDKYLLPKSKIPVIDEKTKRKIKKRDKAQKRRYYYDEKSNV